MTGINILGGHAVLPGVAKAEAAHIHIENGQIASVGKAAPIAEQLDASGLIVAPGIIDLGVFAGFRHHKAEAHAAFGDLAVISALGFLGRAFVFKRFARLLALAFHLLPHIVEFLLNQ